MPLFLIDDHVYLIQSKLGHKINFEKVVTKINHTNILLGGEETDGHIIHYVGDKDQYKDIFD